MNAFTKESAKTFTTMCICILIGTMFIAVIIWCIFWIDAGTKREAMKHQTCAVETTRFTQDGKPATITYAYCGLPIDPESPETSEGN